MGDAIEKPLPFRGAVGVGTVPSSATLVWGNDIPHPNPSPEEEGL